MSTDGSDEILNRRRKYFQRLRSNELPTFPACDENDHSVIDQSPMTNKDVKEGCSISPNLDEETNVFGEPSIKIATDSKTAERIQLLVKKQQDIVNQEVQTEMKTQVLLMEEMSILTERLMEGTKDVKFAYLNLPPHTPLHLHPLISISIYPSRRYLSKSSFRIWN